MTHILPFARPGPIFLSSRAKPGTPPEQRHPQNQVRRCKGREPCTKRLRSWCSVGRFAWCGRGRSRGIRSRVIVSVCIPQCRVSVRNMRLFRPKPMLNERISNDLFLQTHSHTHDGDRRLYENRLTASTPPPCSKSRYTYLSPPVAPPASARYYHR
jgi:hypothetical protein